jgi:hypothetical protein
MTRLGGVMWLVAFGGESAIARRIALTLRVSLMLKISAARIGKTMNALLQQCMGTRRIRLKQSSKIAL